MPGRAAASAASAAACSGVRTGERLTPTLIRPPNSHQPASTSRHTRTGPAPIASMRSRCARLSTITAIAPRCEPWANARNAARSAVG